MPKKRTKNNVGLPNRWRFKHGAYYYRVPEGLEPHWDGKKEFRLGKSLPEAYRSWANRVESHQDQRTIGDLLDRYALEVLPAKAPKTRREQARHVKKLRDVFGALPISAADRRSAIEPHHAYRYYDKREAKTAAKRELEVLSHALTKAVEWGLIKTNPLIGGFTIRGRVTPKARRYVEDWEIIEALKLKPTRKKGSVAMVQAYIRLKLLIGLRMTDMLLLRMTDITEEGIHATPSKTRNSSGMSMVIEWDDQLRETVELCKQARPVHISPYLFCNRRGLPYFDEEKGTANGFESIWQRFMDRVIKETKVELRFTERDLRRKAGSDAESLEHARSLLAHTDTRTTQRFYRARAERVRPGRGIRFEK